MFHNAPYPVKLAHAYYLQATGDTVGASKNLRRRRRGKSQGPRRRARTGRWRSCRTPRCMRCGARPTVALDELDRAYAAGWRDGRTTAIDPLLASLRSEPRFQQLLSRIAAMSPPCGRGRTIQACRDAGGKSTTIDESRTSSRAAVGADMTIGGVGVQWIIGAAAIAALYFWYASIITRRNKVREALSSVDVHLNQRHDLIPNIVALAGRFMEHERALLTDVTRLREEARKTAPTTPAETGKRFALEGELGQRVGQLHGQHGSLSGAQSPIGR